MYKNGLIVVIKFLHSCRTDKISKLEIKVFIIIDPTDAPTISMLGYVLIVVGLFAMCMPSPTYEQDRVPGSF